MTICVLKLFNKYILTSIKGWFHQSRDFARKSRVLFGSIAALERIWYPTPSPVSKLFPTKPLVLIKDESSDEKDSEDEFKSTVEFESTEEVDPPNGEN